MLTLRLTVLFFYFACYILTILLCIYRLELQIWWLNYRLDFLFPFLSSTLAAFGSPRIPNTSLRSKYQGTLFWHRSNRLVWYRADAPSVNLHSSCIALIQSVHQFLSVRFPQRKQWLSRGNPIPIQPIQCKFYLRSTWISWELFRDILTHGLYTTWDRSSISPSKNSLDLFSLPCAPESIMKSSLG